MKKLLLLALGLLASASTARALSPNLSFAKPSIITECDDATVDQGNEAQFSVVAFGFPAGDFQWYKDGVPIRGANTSLLRLGNIQPADAGLYYVVASNSLGFARSRSALLTVVPLPANILRQPASLVRQAGESATFAVSASSSLPLSYQWKRNDVAIPGATGPSLTLNSVTAADAGSYSVDVIPPRGP